MEKIKLNIAALSYSQTQNGAYALILNEEEGNRRLPIVIGSNEAQAIAIELEKMTPSRPLTHDLFKSLCTNYKIKVTEIIIYNLVEGIFFAKMVCELNGEVSEIDARTSDAIALAVRFECPVYTYEFILESAGIVAEEESTDTSLERIEKPLSTNNPFSKDSDDDLQAKLDEALDVEDYEKASKIRDELSRRGKN